MAEPARKVSLADCLGLGQRELVSVVGAGGKSTLLLQLADELTIAGSSVALTTTTKMGTDQIPPGATVIRRLDEPTGALTFLLGEIDEPKVIGVKPEVVDSLFSSGKFDYVLVEADGARRRSIKAPANHEPVIPSLATTVILVAGLDAIDGRIADVAHRPENVASILGREVTDVVRPLDLVTLILSTDGGLARVPTRARVVVTLTYDEPNDHLDEVSHTLAEDVRLERVISFELKG